MSTPRIDKFGTIDIAKCKDLFKSVCDECVYVDEPQNSNVCTRCGILNHPLECYTAKPEIKDINDA